MYTVAQIARHIDASPTTVRNWTADYADYLSPTANPEKGKPRQYNEDDIAVLTTVAVLRDQLASVEDIRQALDAGQRMEPLPQDDDTEETNVSEKPAAADIRATAEKALALYDGQVRDLLAKNSDLTERLMEARERAVAAEKELSILRELYEAAVDTDRDPDKPMGFWEWVQSRRK